MTAQAGARGADRFAALRGRVANFQPHTRQAYFNCPLCRGISQGVANVAFATVVLVCLGCSGTHGQIAAAIGLAPDLSPLGPRHANAPPSQDEPAPRGPTPPGSNGTTSKWNPPPDLDRPNFPVFPFAALPLWLRELANGVGRFVQVSPEAVAVLALGMLSAAARGAFAVRVKQGYEELAVLYVLLAMPTGERKGPLFDKLARVLYDYEASSRERTKAVRAAKRAEKKQLEAALRQAEASGDQEQSLAAAAAVETCQVPPLPRLICANVTTEKLGQLLSEHDETITAASPEATMFGIIAGRYSRNGAPDFDLLLSAYSGEPYTVDRITRESNLLRRPRLTIAFTVQPSVVRSFVGNSIYRQRGLVARFLFCVPPSLVGTRFDDPEPMPESVLRGWRERCEGMLTLASRSDRPSELTLSPEAYRIHRAFAEEIERLLAPGERLVPVMDWANKAAGQAARIAGLLHLADNARSEPLRVQISGETMRQAVELATYFREVAYALMVNDDPLRQDLRLVIAWMVQNNKAVVALRDVYETFKRAGRKGPSGWRPVMEEGVRLGVFRRIMRPPAPGTAGRPPELYEINPGFAPGPDEL